MGDLDPSCVGNQDTNASRLDGQLVILKIWLVVTGKHTKNTGTSPFLMGKSTINGIFILVGGDWNYGLDYDFTYIYIYSWEWKIIPTDELHHFSEG